MEKLREIRQSRSRKWGEVSGRTKWPRPNMLWRESAAIHERVRSLCKVNTDLHVVMVSLTRRVRAYKETDEADELRDHCGPGYRVI